MTRPCGPARLRQPPGSYGCRFVKAPPVPA